MKKLKPLRSIILLGAICFSLPVISQEVIPEPGNAIETLPPQPGKFENIDKIISTDAINISELYEIKYSKASFISGNSINFKIGINSLLVNRHKIIRRGENDFTYIGKIKGMEINDAVISFRNDNITGVIYCDSIKYDLFTGKDNLHYLARIENCCNSGESDDILHIDDNEEIIQDMNELGDDGLNLKSTKVDLDAITSMEEVLLTSTNSCNMRILILYTPAADAIVSDMLNMINNTIDLANQTLENSDVDETWELAYAGLTNYTEAPGDGRYTDLTRFETDGDGYMDEVHDLREKYSADICVLFSECQHTTACGGVASTIDASYNSGFCLCHTYSWEISSFRREIGHLLACRHNNDSGSTPYAYGHGMINSYYNWRTIMGIGWSLTKIPYISNPAKTYQGNPIGTTSWNDCGRVCEQEIPEKVKFEQPEDYVNITSTYVNNMLFADVISEIGVTLQSITIPDGAVFKVRSGTVTMYTGFNVEAGGELEIINETLHDCP